MFDTQGGFVSEPNALPLDQRRLLAGECTRCGDPVPPERGANLCAECTTDGSTRQAAMRARRRANGLCAFCPTRSKKYRCQRCWKKYTAQRRSVTKPRRSVDQRPQLVAKIEVDARYPEGRVRMREAGRGMRGAPNRQQLEQDDVRNLRFAMRELEKAIPAVEAANGLDEGMPRIQREAARKQALAAADLAQRLIDETLDRNKYGQEAQMRLMTREHNRRNRPR